MRKRGLFALASALVAVADQVTKQLIERRLELHESRPVIEGLLSLTHVRNRGAAFGILSDADLPYQSALFAVVSVLALGAIAAYSWKLPPSQRLAQAALALVMGGAVGNLIDRTRLGYVIDFVDVFWKSYHWHAFNVADSAITVGVCLLVLDVLKSPGGAPKTEMAGLTGGGRSE